MAARSAATSPWRIRASSAEACSARRLGHRHLGDWAGDGAAVVAPTPVEVGVADDRHQPGLHLAAAQAVDVADTPSATPPGRCPRPRWRRGPGIGRGNRPHRCAVKSVRGTAAPRGTGKGAAAPAGSELRGSPPGAELKPAGPLTARAGPLRNGRSRPLIRAAGGWGSRAWTPTSPPPCRPSSGGANRSSCKRRA